MNRTSIVQRFARVTDILAGREKVKAPNLDNSTRKHYKGGPGSKKSQAQQRREANKRRRIRARLPMRYK